MTGAEMAMMVIVGFCVAIALRFLIDALPIDDIRFDTASLWRTGLLFGGVIFALTGPVLVTEEVIARRSFLARLIGISVALVWAFALGAVFSELIPVSL